MVPLGTQKGISREINIPSKEGAEHIAMAGCADFARSVGFGQERIEDVKTAVSEACLNAFEHGNKGRSDAKVIVRMSFDSDELLVSVVDEGTGIAKVPVEPSIERKIEGKDPPRGFGMFLIRSLADRVTFEKLGDRGCAVNMVFRMNR